MKQQSTLFVIRKYLLLWSMLFSASTGLLAQPVPQFTASTTGACAPIIIQFTDQSTGNPSSWEWDLGNGTRSFQQHPSVTYLEPGLYTIKLIVRNAFGTDSLVRTNYINIYSRPAVQFTVPSSQGCLPYSAQFTDQTQAGSGTLTAWRWDFGDGTISTEQHPRHEYRIAGQYHVTLLVRNSNGCSDMRVKHDYISVTSVRAGFNQAIQNTCSPTTLNFSNTSTGTGSLSYRWSFGDGATSTAINPSHTYAQAGTYSVKLVTTNAAGCRDSMMRSVVVTPRASAQFTANNTAGCRAPFSTQFTSVAMAGNSYFWDFGDTTFSSDPNPLHLYQDTGRFTVRLVVTNANGCVDSLTRVDYIRIKRPFIEFANIPDSGCAPLTKQFQAVVNSVDNVVSYLWDFGNGQTSTLAAPTHTYTQPGVFHVSLVVRTSSGCSDTMRWQRGIAVGTRPTANFRADTLNACGSYSFRFTDQSTPVSPNGVNSWFWSFGDGGTSFSRNPVRNYGDTGLMTVQLVARYNGCADTATRANYLFVRPSISKFQVQLNCRRKYERTFVNNSVGADSTLWEFGDGTFSNEISPTKTYGTRGTFIVRLTTWNFTYGCSHSITRTIRIIDLQSSFTSPDTVVCRNQPVRIVSSNRGDLSDFYYANYIFSDGTRMNIVTSETVIKRFTRPGLYSVTQISIDRNGCADTLVRSNFIRVNGPTARYRIAVSGACVNNSVSFIDSTQSDGINALQSWTFAFGNGQSQTFTQPPFQHTYNTPGTFLTSMIAQDVTGCRDTFRFNTPVIITRPVAAFVSPDSISCPNSNIRFTNQSNGRSLQYAWDFGDGTSSTSTTPTKVYPVGGNYSIKLRVTDAFGCRDSLTRLNYIRLADPRSIFELSDSIRTCPPLVVNFTNQSQNYSTWEWDFGDGTATTLANPTHFYTYPGSYRTRLTVTSPGGCVSTTEKTIVVKGPRGELSYDPLNVCASSPVNFRVSNLRDHTSFVWDFSDGITLPTTDSILTHIYPHAGSYVPKIMLRDEIGCSVPVVGRDTIRVFKPEAGFSFDGANFCDAGTVRFTDTSRSTLAIAGYSWNFGNGQTSVNQHPIHTYLTPGSYYPSLVITTSLGCTDTIRSSTPVQVVASPRPVITATQGAGCAPLSTSFSASLAVADTGVIQWRWILPNGTTSASTTTPVQVFSVPGSHAVQLIAMNSSGCADTARFDVTAHSSPTITLGRDTLICRGSSITLQAAGGASYSWSSPNENLPVTSGSSIVVTPIQQATYMVTGTSSSGCTGSDTVLIQVQQPFNMNASSAKAICDGNSVNLFASGAALYEWHPSTGLNSTSTANVTARPRQDITYRVIGRDLRGCFADTLEVPVRVHPIPTVNAGPDVTTTNNTPVDLVPTISSDVTSVTWYPTSNNFRNIYPGITVKPTTTTDYTVEVENAGGCKAEDRIRVNVVYARADVFVPNAFSPNGDGVNDVFYPRGTGIFRVRNLRIFNRWGEVVFERSGFQANDPTSGWDGRSRGTRLNPDTYVYVMEIIADNSTSQVFKGDVTILQ